MFSAQILNFLEERLKSDGANRNEMSSMYSNVRSRMYENVESRWARAALQSLLANLDKGENASSCIDLVNDFPNSLPQFDPRIERFKRNDALSTLTFHFGEPK